MGVRYREEPYIFMNETVSVSVLCYYLGCLISSYWSLETELKKRDVETFLTAGIDP